MMKSFWLSRAYLFAVRAADAFDDFGGDLERLGKAGLGAEHGGGRELGQDGRVRVELGLAFDGFESDEHVVLFLEQTDLEHVQARGRGAREGREDVELI